MASVSDKNKGRSTRRVYLAHVLVKFSAGNGCDSHDNLLIKCSNMPTLIIAAGIEACLQSKCSCVFYYYSYDYMDVWIAIHTFYVKTWIVKHVL